MPAPTDSLIQMPCESLERVARSSIPELVQIPDARPRAIALDAEGPTAFHERFSYPASLLDQLGVGNRLTGQ